MPDETTHAHVAAGFLKLIVERHADLGRVIETDFEEKPPPGSVVIGLKRCSPRIRFFEAVASGYGEGVNASTDALTALQADRTAKEASTAAAAHAWANTKVCTPPCHDRGSILAMIADTEDWSHDIHSHPPKAYTWQRVGYMVVKFCS